MGIKMPGLNPQDYPEYVKGTALQNKGKTVRLSNGALAKIDSKGKMQFVQGAPRDYVVAMAKNKQYKAISEKSAKRAFNSHYKNSPKYRSERGRKMARTYDLNHKSEVHRDSRYRRSPNRYDYPGVDLGEKERKKMSAADKKA